MARCCSALWCRVLRFYLMIFVTVGTQHPFPRLIEGVRLAAFGLDEEVIAQVGDDTSQYLGLLVHQSLHPSEFEKTAARARIIVAHAGIGTILTARRLEKPLIVLPRRVDLNEDVNDHQVATARRLVDSRGVYVVWDVEDIAPLLRHERLAATTDCESPTVERLIDHLRAAIASRSFGR